MKEFVEKTNQVLTFIQQQQNTRDPKENANKPLGGEYSLLLAQQRIHDALRENYLGDEGRSIQTLADLGISFTKNATLSFDEKKFEHALETNFNDTVLLMAGDGETTGVMTRLTQALSSIARPGEGIVANQKAGLAAQISELDKQTELKSKATERKLEALKNTLAKAQASLNAVQNQTNFIQGGGASPFPGL
jgi:flagellar hook-associated protein 2